MRIQLNPATTALDNLLESLVDEEDMSLEALAAAGAKIRSKKTKAKVSAISRVKAAAGKAYAGAKKAYAGAKSLAGKKKAKATAVKAKVKAAKTTKGGFLSALWGGLGKAVAKGAGLAARVGVKLPGMKELDQLKDIEGKISSMTFRAKTYSPGGTLYNALIKRKDAALDALADKISASARQVAAQATAVKRTVDSAIAEGDRIFKGAESGKLEVLGTGAFLLKHKQSLDQFKQLELRSNAMVDMYQEGLKQSDKGPSVAKEIAQAARETVAEAGGKAMAFAAETGRVAEEVAEQAISGTKSAAGLVKYWPYLAIGGAALYIFTMAGGPAKLLKGGKE